MASTRTDKVNEIVDLLKKDEVSKVVISGEAGVGKTWLAKKVASEMCKPATEGGLCYLALWLHLNKRYDDEKSFYENIAIQLSLFPEYEETDEDDTKDKEEENAESMKTLKDKIKKELKERNPLAEDKKPETAQNVKNRGGKDAGGPESSSPTGKSYLLLILDDEGHMSGEEQVMKYLKDFPEPNHPLKILITRRPRDGSSTNNNEENLVEIKPLGDEHVIEDLLNEELAKEERESIDSELTSYIVKRSMGLPAAIVVLARSLKRSKPLSKTQKEILKEALSPESSKAPPDSESSISQHRYNPVLQLAYDLLTNDDRLHGAITECFWHCLDFFKHCGAAYYRDLITGWILEGYFDPVNSCDKAYRDGHSILMEFINRGILKIQDDNVVVPEVALSKSIDLRLQGFLGASRLGFAKVYGGNKTKGLGRVTQIDDTIKTVQTRGKGEKLSTILVSGSRLHRETPRKFFEKPAMKDLEVLGLFEPTFEDLVPSIKELKNLRVLVIRDYDLLDSIAELTCLEHLQALEVSGASSLKEIPDDFFKTMTQLQSLNLSGLQIESSPSSISHLTGLCSLILRDCPKLEDLPDIQYLTKLVVVDVRGAHSLKTCSDKNKRQNKTKNKNFVELQQLQLLDLSGSQIDRLPIFQDRRKKRELHSLTRLLLRNCSKLKRLPELRPLAGLQILDLSGTTSLVEMLEVCFEQKKELKILDLSGTNLSELPPTIGELTNLSKLFLRGCSNLVALPSIEGLTHLELFDVFGSAKLETIDEGSFEGMSYLRDVNLSGTKIKTLPKLPNKSNINCSKCIVLPDSSRHEGDDWSKIQEKISSSSVGDGTAATEASEILEEDRESGEKRSNESRASVYPENTDERKKLFFQDDRFKALDQKTRHLFFQEQHSVPPLEIHGSYDPGHVKDLDKAEFVSFVDNGSKSLSFLLDAFKMKSVKGCWLVSCKHMETIFAVEKDAPLQVESLETLWILDLPLLKSICSESLERDCLKNLKKLSLDCCPSIKMLFPASQLPKNLEILHIKFCEQLEKVFEEDCELPNLHTLHLLHLPKLSTIQAKLPQLNDFTNNKCPEQKATKEGLKGLPRRNSNPDWEKIEHNEIATQN